MERGILMKAFYKETALNLLKAEEQDENFLCIKGWDYISTYLCGDMIENIGVISYEVKLKHWRDWVFQIRVGKQGSK